MIKHGDIHTHTLSLSIQTSFLTQNGLLTCPCRDINTKWAIVYEENKDVTFDLYVGSNGHNLFCI